MFLGQYDEKSDSHCKLAYDMYCSILGSVAGDEAMRIKGGVVIGGGIFPIDLEHIILLLKVLN